jgi:Na+/H+ antiporter NhaD/arsenite permease-like protein
MPEQALASTTDVWSQLIVGVVLLVLFALLAKRATHRVVVSMMCVGFVWVVTYLTPFHLISFEAAAAAVDLNVLMLLAGMMAVVGVIKSTGGFTWAVARLTSRARGRPQAAAGLVAWSTAITSAFLDNVTTVVWVTPMAMRLSKRMRLAPVALLVPMVLAANLGGTATLIGDPPNVIIGSGAGLTFMGFIRNVTAPVLVMMVLLQWYTAWYYRDAYASARDAVPDETVEEPELRDPALFRWMLVICVGIAVGFFTQSLTGTPVAVPAVIGAALALVVQDWRYVRRHAPTAEERAHGILRVIEKDIEWPALSFFVFLFILVGAAVHTGLASSVAGGMGWILAYVRDALGLGDRNTLLFAALATCWVSAVISAIIDNVPYVMVSVPILAHFIPTIRGETDVLWWALALGVCLGGVATVPGASANVTAMRLAREEGVEIRYPEYSRFAVPMALLGLLVASLFLVDFVLVGGAQARTTAWLAALALVFVEVVRARRRRAALGR